MALTQLIIIPTAMTGHLFAAAELAKLLIDRDHRLSVTVLIMQIPLNHTKNSAATDSLFHSTADPRLNFVYLPNDNTFTDTGSINFLTHFIESNQPHVARAVADLFSKCEVSSPPRRVRGFVLDMFCTSMIDVADSFGVPSYMFFTSNASFLGLMLYLQKKADEDEHEYMLEYRNSDELLVLPGFVCPLPAKALPTLVLHPGTVGPFLDHARRYRETKGIIVNTFIELEPNLMKFLRSEPDVPKVYPVGPIVNFGQSGNIDKMKRDDSEVLNWLNEQPPSSVVFLCFGSRGSFSKDQVREIAIALEKTGYRFLWLLRQPRKKAEMTVPRDYSKEDVVDVLPDGFLDRTSRVGRVTGWAPQAVVLSHPSVGGFVSHCGWNSTLESIYFGVPMATWPLYAEQQFNAFQLVEELGVAAEITIGYRKDYRMESGEMLSADNIERGIRDMMEEGGGGEKMRKKVKELSEISRNAMKDGGSSCFALGDFLHDLFA